MAGVAKKGPVVRPAFSRSASGSEISGSFFWSAAIGGSGLESSTAPSLACMRDSKETQEHHGLGVSQVFKFLVLLSPSSHLLESSFANCVMTWIFRCEGKELRARGLPILVKTLC